jgi:uncharacterized repeat protein (TIGR03803 family)
VGDDLYGTTDNGGSASKGVIYKLNLKTGKLKTLFNFDWPYGVYPLAPLIQDSGGNFYGTTSGSANGTKSCAQGDYSCGTVFELSASGNYTILYAFAGGADGAAPWAGLTRDSAGNLYGTTLYGGSAGGNGGGTVFEINPNGQETILHAFPNPLDGTGQPMAPLTMDKSGDLFGTTYDGGSGCGSDGCGSLFEITAAGDYVSLYAFPEVGSLGSNPEAGVLYKKGKLLGTTNGNEAGEGTVFEFDLDRSKMKVLHDFEENDADGIRPGAGTLLRDAAGNFYGTTTYGGTGSCTAGCGTVYEVSPGGK